MEQETPAALRRTAEEGARLSGRLLSERFWGERTISFKQSNIDLVTDADKASEEALIPFLRSRYPGRRRGRGEHVGVSVRREATTRTVARG